jgi:ubiquitin-protein ligase E3 A
MHMCRVRFVDEEGLDQGGLTRELFTLALKEIVSTWNILQCCGNNGEYLWFSPTESCEPFETSQLDKEYLLGLIVGLATLNGVLIDFPIVPSVYKLFIGMQVNSKTFESNMRIN